MFSRLSIPIFIDKWTYSNNFRRLLCKRKKYIPVRKSHIFTRSWLHDDCALPTNQLIQYSSDLPSTNYTQRLSLSIFNIVRKITFSYDYKLLLFMVFKDQFGHNGLRSFHIWKLKLNSQQVATSLVIIMIMYIWGKWEYHSQSTSKILDFTII